MEGTVAGLNPQHLLPTVLEGAHNDMARRIVGHYVLLVLGHLLPGQDCSSHLRCVPVLSAKNKGIVDYVLNAKGTC